jgi:hypothetical protein
MYNVEQKGGIDRNLDRKLLPFAVWICYGGSKFFGRRKEDGQRKFDKREKVAYNQDRLIHHSPRNWLDPKAAAREGPDYQQEGLR